MEYTAQGECRVANIAWGEAEWYICHETLTKCYMFYTQQSGSALSNLLYFYTYLLNKQFIKMCPLPALLPLTILVLKLVLTWKKAAQKLWKSGNKDFWSYVCV